MNGFRKKKSHRIRREITDRDFRHFAKEIAYSWVLFCVVSRNPLMEKYVEPSFRMVTEVTAHARFWNIVDAEFAYDLNRWLRASEFVGNVPEKIKAEYASRYSVDRDYIDSLPPDKSKRYGYEQYYICGNL